MSKRMRTGPHALSLIEGAIHMLRRNNALALAEYYVGTLPFIVSILYFWSDMSRNPMAAEYCGPWAAVVALMFIWMKVWQVRFCRHMWYNLQKVVPERWSWRQIFVMTLRQTALQATGIIVLPAAAIIAFPLGWVYAFYQNLCVLDDRGPKTVIGLAASAKAQATLWPFQNHMMLSLVVLFGLFIFFNLAAVLLLLPYFLKILLGIDTVFTISGERMLNTTFLAVLAGLTYLCIDPILKVIYVQRCFYGRSLQTGDDLKFSLRAFSCTTIMTLLIIFVFMPTAWASPNESEGNLRENNIDIQDYVNQLDKKIDVVLEQRRFAWRLARDQKHESTEVHGWFTSTQKWIRQKAGIIIGTIVDWIEAFIEWLIRKLPDSKTSDGSEYKDYREITRWIFYALAIGLTIWLMYVVIRWLMESRAPNADTVKLSERHGDIDLSDENVTAEDLPLDEWLTMAREMMDRNDLRKALRALYFSILSLLAEHQRVRIAPYKSNRDYADELARRAHAEPELLETFDWCIGVFDRSWYGMHPVRRQMLDQFAARQERIATLVQSAA